MKTIPVFVLCLLLAAVGHLGCVTPPAPGGTDTQKSAAETPPEVPKGIAALYVFNISGWTLIPSNLDLTDNGTKFISLPRNTYRKIQIESGKHVFSFTTRRIPIVDIVIEPNRIYYIVAGYRPEKSWAFPIGGDPLFIKEISKEEAEALMVELSTN